MSATPRFRRRKEDRPAEITAAALAVFARKGYAATRVIDVARRAGVSKGLLYLYFKTKEDLFKSVIRSFVVPRVTALRTAVEDSDLTVEEFLRGPFTQLIMSVADSDAEVVVRLLIAEGPKHPDLTAYYCNEVILEGMTIVRNLLEKGVERGEIRPTALHEFPQIMFSGVLVSTIWTSLFNRHHPIDSKAMIKAHIDLMISALHNKDSDL
ncbi:MAG TPA: TetR/AcrR family transcriptional regulator [Woeseiaceae bacterium]